MMQIIYIERVEIDKNKVVNEEIKDSSDQTELKFRPEDYCPLKISDDTCRVTVPQNVCILYVCA